MADSTRDRDQQAPTRPTADSKLDDRGKPPRDRSQLDEEELNRVTGGISEEH